MPLDCGRLAERARLGFGGSREAAFALADGFGFCWMTAYYC